ncbi:PKD domain protein [compost metagenome]
MLCKSRLIVLSLVFLMLNFDAKSQCALLCNMDFEDEVIALPNNTQTVPQSSVSCWQTTASDGGIEVWGTGFNGVPSYSGQQFIELNANVISTLFQEFTSVPGSAAVISFAHRGRMGTDVMNVSIGPVGGPYVNLGNFSDGPTWGYYQVNYTFPAGPEVPYTLRFASVSSVGGSTVGNFLDAISVDLNLPPVFDPIPHLCIGSVPPALPTTSLNNFTGTWSPSVISTAVGGTATYTFTPGAGQCGQPYTMNVTVGLAIAPLFTQVPATCQGNAVPLLPGTSNNLFTGTWSPATIDNSASGVYTFTPASGQCATTTTMNITINQRVTPGFLQAGPYCEGTVIPALPVTSTDLPAIAGTWSPPLNNTQTTTYQFTPNTNACANPTTMTIAIQPKVVPQFDPLAAVCQNDSPSPLPTASANSPAVLGSWLPPVLPTTTPGTFTSIFTPATGECATDVTISLEVKPRPTVQLTPASAELCLGESVGLTASGADTYDWTPQGTLDFTDDSHATATPSETTDYTVTGWINGCSSDNVVTVTVNNPVTPVFAPSGPYCAGSEISALPLNSVNGIAGSWLPAINNTQTTNYTFTPNTGECALPVSLSIVINQPVLPDFPAIDSICAGEEQPVLLLQDVNGISGSWTPEDLDNRNSGTYTFTPNPGECALPVSFPAIVVQNPDANFKASATQLEFTMTTVNFHNESTNAVSYSWDFGDGDSATAVHPHHTFPANAGSYLVQLTATNAFGCQDTFYRQIVVKEDLFVFVPNAFTPDGDEYNNTFKGYVSGDFDPANFSMLIFNRWGNLIFESKDVNVGWDGTYDGKLVQEGMYTWMIQLKTMVSDDKKTFNGSVTLLK